MITNLIWALSGFIAIAMTIFYASWQDAPQDLAGAGSIKKLKAQFRLSWQSFLKYLSNHFPPTVFTVVLYTFFVAGWWLNGIDLVIQFVQWVMQFMTTADMTAPTTPQQSFFEQGQITILAPIVASLMWYVINQRWMKSKKPHETPKV